MTTFDVTTLRLLRLQYLLLLSIFFSFWVLSTSTTGDAFLSRASGWAANLRIGLFDFASTYNFYSMYSIVTTDMRYCQAVL